MFSLGLTSEKFDDFFAWQRNSGWINHPERGYFDGKVQDLVSTSFATNAYVDM
jgi:hypothetical protein